jgi:hypothetical protein
VTERPFLLGDNLLELGTHILTLLAQFQDHREGLVLPQAPGEAVDVDGKGQVLHQWLLAPKRQPQPITESPLATRRGRNHRRTPHHPKD